MRPIRSASTAYPDPISRANATKPISTTWRALQTALTELGYDSFLSYGTLLGAVRDHDFIEHDDDVDMAVVLKSPEAKAEMTALCAELRDPRLQGAIVPVAAAARRAQCAAVNARSTCSR